MKYHQGTQGEATTCFGEEIMARARKRRLWLSAAPFVTLEGEKGMGCPSFVRHVAENARVCLAADKGVHSAKAGDETGYDARVGVYGENDAWSDPGRKQSGSAPKEI
jgi:hypothetical protein